jgi:nitrite reductase/ring-hydroxylating ferredoxin subunit
VRVSAEDAWGAVIVTRKGDAVSAFRNKCPHAGYPLQHSSGRVIVQEGCFIVCSAHGASYALETGACAGGPCNGEGLQRIDIEVRAGKVMTR